MVMQALAGVYKAARGICETPRLDPSLWRRRGTTIVVELAQVPQLAQKGGAVFIRGRRLRARGLPLRAPLLIVNIGDNRFAAFENRCTHMLHRKLDPVPGQDRLRCCSILHSEFDLEGNPVSGPAGKPITRYRAEVAGDELIITI